MRDGTESSGGGGGGGGGNVVSALKAQLVELGTELGHCTESIAQLQASERQTIEATGALRREWASSVQESTVTLSELRQICEENEQLLMGKKAHDRPLFFSLQTPIASAVRHYCAIHSPAAIIRCCARDPIGGRLQQRFRQ